ncbi:MAG: NUDIX domain-containing protein [Candidatus Acetothermia bacterium]|jgi:8-oxo-dGTP pyrophosphatase MutT (NUDIX family)|nr:NUDIX domain-containing protein [Candidatus Acetothermia bacterium]MDH7504890.1 NUDIX domain-containing protein [Candidatus Acetothermia bacterium]
MAQEEWSAGVILFRRAPEGRRYLLLQHSEGHWAFPKGQIERDEDLKEAACRELREETQIRSTRLVPGFQGLIEYGLAREGQPVQKRVIYFLGETEEEDVRLSPEHAGFAWLSYQEALARLTYDNSKWLLRQAEQFLNEAG